MTIMTQCNGYDCGPVAAHNACVLLGIKPPTFTKIRKMMGTDREGTGEEGMAKAMHLLPFEALTLDYLDSVERKSVIFELMTGAVVLLGYYAGEEGHYSAIKYDGEGFLAYNWASDMVVETRSYKKLKPIVQISFVWLKEKILDPNSEFYILRAP